MEVESGIEIETQRRRNTDTKRQRAAETQIPDTPVYTTTDP